MRTNSIFIFYILFSILSLSICAPPPSIEPMEKIETEAPIINYEGNKFPFLPQTYSGSGAYIELTHSKVTTTFFDDYKIIEHELTLTAKNLEQRYRFTKWSFSTNLEGLTIKDNYCQIFVNGEPSTRECQATQTPDTKTKKVTLSYNMELYNNEQMKVTYIFKKAKTNSILFKEESIVIPLFSDSIYCDYKFIIPKGHISLGLRDNLLTKESNTLFTYKGNCPTDGENGNDVIRYSPELVSWKADTGIYLEHPSRFTNNVIFTFPRYYRGGKLRNSFYRLFSTQGQMFKEKNKINIDQNLEFEIPAANYDKVGVELHTSFSN